MRTQQNICKKLFVGWVKPPFKKKQWAHIVGFLVRFFGHQSTPLSAIRLLPTQFALSFPYLPTLTGDRRWHHFVFMEFYGRFACFWKNFEVHGDLSMG